MWQRCARKSSPGRCCGFLRPSLLPWLRATDRLIWEPPAVPDAKGNLRDDIVMTFPKPTAATLGLLYMQGLGVPKDYLQAYMWFARTRKTAPAPTTT